jgi:hypothetical protein
MPLTLVGFLPLKNENYSLLSLISRKIFLFFLLFSLFKKKKKKIEFFTKGNFYFSMVKIRVFWIDFGQI